VAGNAAIPEKRLLIKTLPKRGGFEERKSARKSSPSVDARPAKGRPLFRKRVGLRRDDRRRHLLPRRLVK